MNCQRICPVKGFVHPDLYYQGCKHQPKTSGTVYLYAKKHLYPLASEAITAPSNQVVLAATHKLMQEFYIEFIEDE